MTSPFAAAFSVPLKKDPLNGSSMDEDTFRLFPSSWTLFGGYLGTTLLLNAILSVLMIWLFNMRWRVSQ